MDWCPTFDCGITFQEFKLRMNPYLSNFAKYLIANWAYIQIPCFIGHLACQLGHIIHMNSSSVMFLGYNGYDGG